VALGPAPDLDPWMLLWWNRQTRHVRVGCTLSREIWVYADLPATAVDGLALDRLLGLLVEGALAVRDYARRARAPRPPSGWDGRASPTAPPPVYTDGRAARVGRLASRPM
jgi:hypothetical protein